jgi:hypothetical protein
LPTTRPCRRPRPPSPRPDTEWGGRPTTYRVVQSLRFTIAFSPAEIDRLDAFRKKRNLSNYTRAGAVSDQEAEEMAALAREVRRAVEEWLRAQHLHLLEGH